jgi:hypothetical protein
VTAATGSHRQGYARYRSSSVKSVSCRPAGPSSRALSEFQGVRVGSATTVAPAAASARVVSLLSSTSNASRTWPATLRPTSNLVDERGVRLVEQLERRAAGLEDGDAAVLGGERLTLAQPEHVAVEGERLVVVGRGDGYAQLANR